MGRIPLGVFATAAATCLATGSAGHTQPITSLANYRFVGTSTPQGSPPWDVTIDFSNGEAVWSKAADGARATRLVSGYSLNGERISVNLQARSPVGIPDLVCNGTRTDRLVDATCYANAGAPPERLVGRLERR